MLGAIRPTGTGGGAVASVYGRTGAVVAAANDYAASQIAGLGGNAAPLVIKSSALQTLVATTSILCNAGTVAITAASAITLTGNPQIAVGITDQKITVVNVGSFPVTFVPGNGLLLQQNTILYGGRSLGFTYSSVFSSWVLDGIIPESVGLTGVPTAPNPAWNTNSNQIAPTGFVYKHLYDHDSPGWRTLTLNAGWANLGPTWGNAAIKRIGRDMVFLRGVLSVSGTYSANIFSGANVIPLDCRPSVRMSMVALASTGATQVDINADGTVSQYAALTAGQLQFLNLMWFL